MTPTPTRFVLPARTARHRRATAALAALLVGIVALAGSVLAPSSARPADSADSSRARAGEVGLFAEDTPKRAVKDRSPRPVEVGLQFASSVDGSVTGVQVFKIARAKGATPRRASLWTSRGKRLAKARITPSEGAGWVTVRFSEAVAIRADRTYTVSVFAPQGRYAHTVRGLRTARNRGVLSAGGTRAGVLRHGSRSGFPARVRHRSNYWVDVLFRAGDKVKPPPPTTEKAFPTQDTTGVPSGWTPRQVVSGTYRVTQPGAVVEDVQVNGSIEVAAPNVTLRRVEVVGGNIDNFAGPTCQSGLVVEDSTVRRSTRATSASDAAAINAGSYTARRVEIDGVAEGFRVGGRSSGCGPVLIEDSWAKVVRPDECGDWHGDGIQGYGAAALTVRNTSLILDESGCGGTAAFFYPSGQDNTSVDIDRLLVQGGGYPFRLGTPGTVRGLAVVQDSGFYGPINVKCSAITEWQADLVTVAANGVTTPLRSLPCNMEQGN